MMGTNYWWVVRGGWDDWVLVGDAHLEDDEETGWENGGEVEGDADPSEAVP